MNIKIHNISFLLSLTIMCLSFLCRAENNPLLKDCIHCYTSDWAIVNRRYDVCAFFSLF